MRGRPCGWALHWPSSPTLLQRSTPRTRIGFPPPPGLPTPTYVPEKGAERHSPGFGARVGGGNTAAQDTRPRDQPKCGVVSLDPNRSASRKKDLFGRQVARGGRPEEGRGEEARGPYPLQGWPLPAAAGGSSTGGRRRLRGAIRRLPCCPAAPAPPPRGDLRRSGSPTACECTRPGGRARHRRGPRAHALCRSGRAPAREGRSAAPRGTAHQDKCCQSRERTNQDSQVLAL